MYFFCYLFCRLKKKYYLCNTEKEKKETPEKKCLTKRTNNFEVMKRDFVEVLKLGDAILLGGDLSSETEQAFFYAASAFLSKYSVHYYCNEIEFYIERVNKKIVFNA